MTTYDEYAREYYHRNKFKIREKTREYKKKYNREYYLENKEVLLEKAKEKNRLRPRKRGRIRSRKNSGVFHPADGLYF